MNERLLTTPDGRNVLHMQRRLTHPPAKVWRALTEPEHLARWFPTEVRIEGDRVRFGFGPDGTVIAHDPPHLFAFTWGEDELRWKLSPDTTGGTLLDFTHTFADRHGAASFASGWHTCFTALARLLDGARPPAPGDTAALHEHYVAILGLSSGAVRGDTVRLERQLTRPAPEVWQALHGDQATIGTPPPAPFAASGVEAGPVTRVEPGKLLEYAAGAGTVRWELAEGTGHGARLVITHTGDPAALPAWRAHVEDLAAALAALARPGA
ncbi:SRPBCC family protein [Nonomuraea muscovyensis]